jgi:hypothetical protein
LQSGLFLSGSFAPFLWTDASTVSSRAAIKAFAAFGSTPARSARWVASEAFVNESLIGFKGAAATDFFSAGAAVFFATGAAVFLLAGVAFFVAGAAAYFVAGAAVFLVPVVAMNSSFLVKGCPRPLPLRRHRLTQRSKSSGWAPAYQHLHEDATSGALS